MPSASDRMATSVKPGAFVYPLYRAFRDAAGGAAT
jgi:hypothetical protein